MLLIFGSPSLIEHALRVEQGRLAGVNPEPYFIDALNRIDHYPASQIADYTPHNWPSKNG